MTHLTLIDQVAREMTDRELSADLRARILAALPVSRRRWWHLRPALVPAAAAILAMAWLLAAAPDGTLLRDAPHTESAFGRLTAAVWPPAAPMASLPSDASKVPGRNRGGARSAEELAWLARSVPPLPAVEPLVFDPIQPTALSIVPITVDPIVPEAIALAPIDPRSVERH